MRRTLAAIAIALVLLPVAAFADVELPPTYEPRVVKEVGDAIASPHGQLVRNQLGPAGKVLDAGECVGESRYETRPSGLSYGGECRRLKIIFGPIISKPGQDDVLIQPVTFEKPLYDGYIVRFKPDLVDVLGNTPPVEEMHLHHGTWLNTYPSYGQGPWIASGEEKTIVTWPYRYGVRVGATDQWLFLHMVHNATVEPTAVYATYDIDFIPAAAGSAIQPDGRPLLTNTRGIWLDTGGSNFHPETETYFLNPIFNAQKGFGGTVSTSPGYEGVRTCRFPDYNCATLNSNGNVSAQQGKDVSDEVSGWVKDITTATLGGQQTGTLILMGGHVHNGGLATEVELVRGNQSRLINVSEAYYWQPAPNSDRIGGRPVSWDYSQTGSTLDHGWAINVRAGDKLVLNGIYETEIGSWYEQMGIVMSWVVPGGIPEGIDVFAPGVTMDSGIPSVAVVPNGPDGLPLAKTCVPSRTNVCQRGQITHGHIPSSGNHGWGHGSNPVNWAAAPDGAHLNEVAIGGFSYGLTDHGLARTFGVPYVNLGESISFHNADTADYMWHTITRCALPCTGPTTVDYPIADGGSGIVPDLMDFDSTQLGVGTGPTQRTSWTFTPTEQGTFAFFCRVHPSMRGVFRVK